MPNFFVSVCITTYNHERYIRACIDSVLMQSEVASLEVLIGDDVSNDGTEDIIRAMAECQQSVIRYIRYTEKKGAAENLAFLIRESRGAYIAHLDGDDFWLPGKLASQLAFLEEHADCPAVYSNAFCIQDDGTPTGIFSNQQSTRLHIPDLIRRGNFLHHSSILYRADLKQHILGPDCNLLDYSIHLQLAGHGALGYLSTPLTVYRVSSNSSILMHRNNHVRELYWEALRNTKPPGLTPEELGAGMAEFMRSVFFRAIRIRSWALVKEWWPRVLAEAPIGRIRMLAWASWSIVRVGLIESLSTVCRGVTGNPLRVLYRR